MNFLVIVVAVIIIFVVVNKFNNRGIKQMNVETAQELLNDPDVTILDVRNPEEYGQGHLHKAKLLPVSELSARIGELAALKDKKFLVYCHAGSRSAAASQILIKNGFSQVNNLQGGITAWINAGKKIVK